MVSHASGIWTLNCFTVSLRKPSDHLEKGCAVLAGPQSTGHHPHRYYVLSEFQPDRATFRSLSLFFLWGTWSSLVSRENPAVKCAVRDFDNFLA